MVSVIIMAGMETGVITLPVSLPARQLFKIDQQTDWPEPAYFTPYLNAINANNLPIRFVDDAKVDFAERYYEQVIFEMMSHLVFLSCTVAASLEII